MGKELTGNRLSRFTPPRRGPRATAKACLHHATAALLAAAVLLVGCGPKAQLPADAVTPDISLAATAPVRWRVNSALRQSTYIRLDLPVVIAGMRITLSQPIKLDEAPSAAATQPDEQIAPSGHAVDWDASGGGISLLSTRIVRGSIEGPRVDQLTGQPRSAADGGTHLVPVPVERDAAGARVFTLTEPMPAYLRLDVPNGMEPGEYRFGATIEAPGKPPEQHALAVSVSDLALPTEPRALGIMTTTMTKLSTIFPETFGAVTVNYLDRGGQAEPEQRAATEQLDALVRAARREGMALFVEDLTPQVRVDEHGLVAVDWDAYDRVMAPYMDGSAFEDRLPLPVWLAPVPPRRIRDSSTQLWQYIQACARHFSDRGWVGQPVFLHPALADGPPGADRADERREYEALRGRVVEMMRLHMPREMLAVTTPDIAGAVGAAAQDTGAATGSAGASVPHGQLWVVGMDNDARLPPSGPMASEWSVRVWPWMCVARTGTLAAPGVRGFVWRDALADVAELKGGDELHSPLLVVQRETTAAAVPSAAPATLPAVDAAPSPIRAVVPSLRMAWLSAGLNDAALLGLLEKRSDPAVVREVLAGVVGRSGLRDEATTPSENAWPTAPSGYLYAGWPTERTTWSQVTPMLERLVLARDPGQATRVAANDPLYMAARMWLAESRRPVARVAGYDFSVRPGRAGVGAGGSIIDAQVRVLAENPVADAAEFDIRFFSLPGDFDMAPPPASPGMTPPVGSSIRRRTLALPPVGMGSIDLPVAGHTDALLQSPALDRLELTERHGGSVLRLPVRIPVYRTHATDQWAGGSPRPDGNASDWPMDPQVRVFGEMIAGLRYAARPDLLSATAREDGSPAAVRWAFDESNLYLLARCPQDTVSDERNTEWPIRERRWWGSDVLQVQIADVAPGNARRIVQLAFKPAGVLLVRTGTLARAADGTSRIEWRDSGPADAGGGGAAVRYGIAVERREGRTAGWVVEAAIPRAWFPGKIEGLAAPAWRINILRHRASDLASMSWSGPLVDDLDVGMMGLLLGE